MIELEMGVFNLTRLWLEKSWESVEQMHVLGIGLCGGGPIKLLVSSPRCCHPYKLNKCIFFLFNKFCPLAFQKWVCPPSLWGDAIMSNKFTLKLNLVGIWLRHQMLLVVEILESFPTCLIRRNLDYMLIFLYTELLMLYK